MSVADIRSLFDFRVTKKWANMMVKTKVHNSVFLIIINLLVPHCCEIRTYFFL